MSKPTYVVNDPEQLDLKFYESYDEHFLWNKARTLWVASAHSKEFTSWVEQMEGEAEGFDRAFFDVLRAEIHFAEFQQFEALFALLLAGYQDLPHWLYLTTYNTGEVKRKVEAFLRGDMAAVTDGSEATMNGFLNSAVYGGSLPLDEDQQSRWQENLDNIAWLLRRVGKRYLEGAEYNAYKHGLRVITGQTYLRMAPSDNPEHGMIWASDDSLRFLELREERQGQKVVYETTKHFNPAESLNHLFVMVGLLETIKSVRLTGLQGGGSTRLRTFFDVNRDGLHRLSLGRKWSFTT